MEKQARNAGLRTWGRESLDVHHVVVKSETIAKLRDV